MKDTPPSCAGFRKSALASSLRPNLTVMGSLWVGVGIAIIGTFASFPSTTEVTVSRYIILFALKNYWREGVERSFVICLLIKMTQRIGRNCVFILENTHPNKELIGTHLIATKPVNVT